MTRAPPTSQIRESLRFETRILCHKINDLKSNRDKTIQTRRPDTSMDYALFMQILKTYGNPDSLGAWSNVKANWGNDGSPNAPDRLPDSPCVHRCIPKSCLPSSTPTESAGSWYPHDKRCQATEEWSDVRPSTRDQSRIFSSLLQHEL